MEYLDSCAVVPRRIICLLAASVFVNLYMCSEGAEEACTLVVAFRCSSEMLMKT